MFLHTNLNYFTERKNQQYKAEIVNILLIDQFSTQLGIDVYEVKVFICRIRFFIQLVKIGYNLIESMVYDN